MAKINISTNWVKLPTLPSISTTNTQPTNVPNNGLIAMNPQGTISLRDTIPEPFPDSLQGLLEGIQNKNLNYGMPSILSLEKSTPKNELLAGLQQGKNFGLPSIDDLQNKEKIHNNFNNTFDQNYVNPSVNTLTTPEQFQSGVEPYIQPQNSNTGFMEHPFKNSYDALKKGINSPVGRGLLMAGIVGATGGGGLEALGYGAGVYGKNKALTLQDQQNRQLLTQLGVDPSSLGGYINGDTVKQYMEAGKYQRDNKSQALKDIEMQYDILKKQSESPYYDANAKAESLKKMADLEKTYQDIQTGKVTLKYAEPKARAEISNLNSQADFNANIKPTLATAQIEGLNARNSLVPLQAQNIQSEIATREANVKAKAQKAAQGKGLTQSQVDKISNLTNSINQVENLKNIYSDKNKAGLFGVTGAVRRANPLAQYSDNDVNLYNQDLGTLKQLIAKDFENGRLSDADRAFYQKTLFNPNVSQKDFINALSKYQISSKQKHNNNLRVLQSAGYNVSGYNGYGNNSQSQTQQTNNNVYTQTSRIPQKAIDYLIANPNLRNEFEAKYGSGTAKQLLGY